MGHLCGSTCKRKTGTVCATYRTGGNARVIAVDDNDKPVKPDGRRLHATPHEKGTAVDLYFDGLSYRRTAENVGQHFGRDTTQMMVYR